MLSLQAPPGSNEQPPSMAAASLVTNDSFEMLSHATSTPVATPISAATPTATPRRDSLQGQSSTDSGHLERRRSSRYRKRASIHSLHSVGSRKFSNVSRSSEGLVELRRESSGTSRSSMLIVNKCAESDEEGSIRPEWALDQIELSDSDSDLEFFDAKGK